MLEGNLMLDDIYVGLFLAGLLSALILLGAICFNEYLFLTYYEWLLLLTEAYLY